LVPTPVYPTRPDETLLTQNLLGSPNSIGKAFQTSSLPGHTRKFTGTVKVHETPPVYVYDMAGIMVPYLGKGEEGMERGLKLGLTCQYRIA
jgi:hypothetical protein